MPPHDTSEIELPICHAEGSAGGTEIVEVVRLGHNHYQLLYSPGVIEGLAKGDQIEIAEDDPRGFRVLSRGGYLCVWFYFETPGLNRSREGDAVRAAVENFGGICDGGGNTHLIFSIPVDLGFPEVESLMNHLSGQYAGSSWLYGNVYDPWNDFEPLGWWE